VNIDGISGYEAPGLAGGKGPAGQRPDKAAERPAGDTGVEVAESARTYIDKAQAAEEVDPAAVAEAKRLLAEGLLDTPEAAARAAEAILGQSASE